jgi:integrase
VSVHKRGGKHWVRYRDPDGRERSRTFTRRDDAILFDADIKRRKALGTALVRELDRRDITLDEFVRTGFRTHASTQLSRKSREQYAWALERHLSELVHEPLAALDVPRLAAHQTYLLERGRTPNTVRQAILKLSGVLQVAVEHGYLTANPVRSLRKVPAEPRAEIRPLAPAELEALADAFSGRDRIIVLLGAHLGLRPIEIRSVPWHNFDGRNLIVGRAQTKRSAARTRVVDVPAGTAAELKAWRLEAGVPDADEPIVPIGRDGLRLFGYKHLSPAAKRITGRDDVSPYTLRHSHASALHYCGFTVPEAADRMGHSPVVHIQHYAHIIKTLGSQRYPDLDALIAAARAELCTPRVQDREPR